MNTSTTNQTIIPSRQSTSPADYTAVVYFHGMGSQRRYEEVSRLIDVLDKHAHDSSSAGNGRLSRIRARLEPNQTPGLKDRSFIKVTHSVKNSAGQFDYSAFRFHEVYWAPLTAGIATNMGVLKWVLQQVTTPFKTLFFTPWRLRQRLRSAALFELRELTGGTSQANAKDYGKLAIVYNDFEGPSARNNPNYKKGTYDEFLRYIEKDSRYHKRPNTSKRLVQLARVWKRQYTLTEVKNMAVILSLFVAILLAIGSAIGLSLMGLNWIASHTSFTFLQSLSALKPTYSNAIGIALILFAGLGITRFLRDYMGDVQLWTSYEETEKKHEIREEILKRSVEALSHVLLDPKCQRIVIVSHSLGTTIALDSLLEFGKINRAINPQDPMTGKFNLQKIDHFITMGSPIDKVYYFFESHTGKYHRYNRVVEEIRGDIGTAPFSKNKHPFIHWINFWDSADIISGRIHSPSSRTKPHLAIDNVHVRTYSVPSPGRSHSGYFYNSSVVEKMFDTIFKQAYSFSLAPKLSNGKPNYAAQYIKMQQPKSMVRWLQFAVLLIPWLILVYLLKSYLY